MIDLQEVEVESGGVRLLDPVSIHVNSGETLVIRGENGAGKSTLLRVLSGLIPVTAGRVLVGDTVPDLRKGSFRSLVASMVGLPPLASDLTVHEHISMVASTWFHDEQEAASARERVLKDLGISNLGARFPHELSSGQQQLFGLALTLVRPCEVLILDEPEQRLDLDRINMVIRVLKNLQDSGTTIILATHHELLASALANSTVTLESAA